MTSKAHYEKVARAIKAHLAAELEDSPSRKVIISLAVYLARIYAAENPYFKYNKFYEACGIESKETQYV